MELHPVGLARRDRYWRNPAESRERAVVRKSIQVLARRDEQRGGVLDSDAATTQQVGCARFDQSGQLRIHRRDLFVEELHASTEQWQ